MHKLYTDGTYHSHIDCAGIGGYIRQEETTLFKFSEEISEAKHFNHHEHVAVIYGLKKALEMNIHNIKVYSDMDYCSKYLNQDLNTFKPNSSNEINRELVVEIITLAKQFQSIKFCHVPREKNKKAHKLANAIYSKRQLTFKVEPPVKPHKGRRTKLKELGSVAGFPVFLDPTKTITFFTFDCHVEIKLTDLASLESKEIRLMRYPYKKDMVDAIKKLTKDFPPEEKINFYMDQESDFLKTILFG